MEAVGASETAIREAELRIEVARTRLTMHWALLIYVLLAGMDLFVGARIDRSTGIEVAKLIDFGIAARTSAIGTDSHAAVGTPHYMAPEQIHGAPATPATDLYALGAVWYFALTGRAPLERDAAGAALVAQLQDHVAPPSTLVPSLPPGVDALVLRCLAKDPADRFASSRAIEEELGSGAPGRVVVPRPTARDGAFAGGDVTDDAESHEHRVSYVRLQAILVWVGYLWLAMGVLDAIVALQPGTLGLPAMLGIRASGAVVIFACARWLRRGRPSRRALVWTQTTAFAALAISCALLATASSGLQSPMIATMFFVVIAQGLVVPDRIAVSAPRLLITVVVFNATLWLGSLVRQQAASELGIYFQYEVTIVAIAVATAFVGRIYWSLRQKLYEQRVVGQYKLKRMIGAGGMGEVWSADHPSLGREVAIKLLKTAQTSPDIVPRFELEIRALAELVHPHTVRVYDCGTTEDGILYYVMEHLRGATVAHAIRASGAFEARRAIRIARQIAAALTEAHAAGIVHRDLKSDNLFLTTVGDDPDYVKILDFGIARRIFDQGLTQTGTILGTPAFMAPEQALGGAADGRTDIYALGVILFHMLNTRLPFAGSSIDLMLAHLNTPAPRVSTHVALPDALDELVARCLEKDPNRRPASAAELEHSLAALDQDYATLTITAPPVRNIASEAALGVTLPRIARDADHANADTVPARKPR